MTYVLFFVCISRIKIKDSTKGIRDTSQALSNHHFSLNFRVAVGKNCLRIRLVINIRVTSCMGSNPVKGKPFVSLSMKIYTMDGSEYLNLYSTSHLNESNIRLKQLTSGLSNNHAVNAIYFRDLNCDRSYIFPSNASFICMTQQGVCMFTLIVQYWLVPGKFSTGWFQKSSVLVGSRKVQYWLVPGKELSFYKLLAS